MKKRFYHLTRDLHLYLGLFSSPFVLVFSISVFFIVHAWLPGSGQKSSVTTIVPDWSLPENWQTLSGRPLIDALKPSLEKAHVNGEVGFVRHLIQDEKLVIPVTIPGRETIVTISLTNHTATIATRETGLAATLLLLHKSPGQHGPAIRMNWFYMKAWRWMADATVYLILFITVSGIYLWYVLRSERKVGSILLVAGAFSFFAMVYALSH